MPAHISGQHHVDDGLAHRGELLAGHAGEDVDRRLRQGQLEGQRHMMVLEHRLIVVQQRQRVPRVDQKGVAAADEQSSSSSSSGGGAYRPG